MLVGCHLFYLIICVLYHEKNVNAFWQTSEARDRLMQTRRVYRFGDTTKVLERTIVLIITEGDEISRTMNICRSLPRM